MRELTTIGIAHDASGTEDLVAKGREWIERELSCRHPWLDLFGEERQECEREIVEYDKG